jgi:dephospho-CoA kinase
VGLANVETRLCRGQHVGLVTVGPRSLIGLTGGIAAGKTEALNAFQRLGAETISTDAVARELLRTPELRDRLVERWGDEVAPGGEVDRANVARLVFESPEELEWLESQLHPLVGSRVVEWAGGLPADAALAVVEVPLLFESGMDELFDAVVCVVAPDELRRERETGRDLVALEGRSARQLSQEEKAERATHVITNDGTLAELEAQIAALVHELREDRDAGE